MDISDLVGQSFFTIDGKDIWKLEMSCLQPSCTLRNVETGAKEHFGMGGLTAKLFKRIQMPETDR